MWFSFATTFRWTQLLSHEQKSSRHGSPHNLRLTFFWPLAGKKTQDVNFNFQQWQNIAQRKTRIKVGNT